MRVFTLILAAFSALCWTAAAGVIHLDVSKNGDVAIDIDSRSQTLGTEAPGVEIDKLQYQLDAESTVPENYDVDLDYEVHRGFESEDGSYLNFSNIPFAEPPLGHLRFRPPIPPQGYREGVNEGKKLRICPQMQVGWVPKAIDFLNCYAGAVNTTQTCSFKNNWTDPFEPENYGPLKPNDDPVSEDCLLLDVFVPKSVWQSRNDDKKPKAPVVAWIYGGGYIYGWKSQAGSPAGFFEAAAKDDGQEIIYVAMNYRLGAFGWLGGQAFQGAGGVPNLGLHDQLRALEWIQDYIDLFGGDRDSVTVMGQSAGGSSILHHLTSYEGDADVKPNFARAIMQSPAFLPEGDPGATNLAYYEFLIRAGATSLSDLRTKDTADLMKINALMTYYSQYGLFRFGPSVDYYYVPKLPGQLLAEKKYHKNISVMLGYTTLDGLLFTPPWLRNNDDLSKYIENLYPALSNDSLNTIKQSDFYGIPKNALEVSKINAVSDLLDDVAVSCNSYYVTEAVLATGDVPVYRYVFGAKPAIHGSDVPFTYYPTTVVPDFVDPGLAKLMQQKFVNFIRSGDPNGNESPKWPQYKLDNGISTRIIMNFGSLAGSGSYVSGDTLKRKRCEFWQKAPFRKPEDFSLLQKQSPDEWEL